MQKTIRVGLAGNPNTGKTSVFNAIAGARQRVANYPGVTVEKKEGTRTHAGRRIDVIDLPGIYSLTTQSTEELIARRVLIDEELDVVVDVLDASNLERNLYLAVQLAELGVQLVLAFNMSDRARARGIEYDEAKLSRLFGIPIVSTVGRTGEGIPQLLDEIVLAAQRQPRSGAAGVRYGRDIEEAIGGLERMLAAGNGNIPAVRRRWLAVKLLEDDADVREKIESEELLRSAETGIAAIEQNCGEHPEVLIANHRYAFISGVCEEGVRFPRDEGETFSDKVDSVVTQRILALPIFLGTMYLVFFATFTLGNPVTALLENLFAWTARVLETSWPSALSGPLKSLVIDGIIGGVGGVIVFLPNIFFLFLAIVILEDSGYMARAAFIMDRFMHKVGLQGKSFIPMLIGFGCSVPAIMATRTLDNRRDRLITMLVVPLMSCSARLTVYALIIPAFFPQPRQAPMLWLMYVIGIVLAIIGASLLRATVFKGESAAFVMELPPYRLPTLKGAALHVWERAWLYLRKAGTTILAFSIVLWFLTAYPRRDVDATPPGSAATAELSHSFAGRLGNLMTPVLAPMGFDWRIGTALIGAIGAKEVFVAQMGIVYAIGDTTPEGLRTQLRRNYPPLVAFCIMLFVLIGMPCIATVAVTRREANSWKWAIAQFCILTTVAYVLTVIVYQLGVLFGIGV
ncbi:MAG: ferrous iron transport protein B [Candidatus Krumholzibacteria bacterium]